MVNDNWEVAWLQRSSARPMFRRGNKPKNIAPHWAFFPLLSIAIFVQGCVSVGNVVDDGCVDLVDYKFVGENTED